MILRCRNCGNHGWTVEEDEENLGKFTFTCTACGAVEERDYAEY